MYASRHSPTLLPSSITFYPSAATWPALFDRAFDYSDDGHAIKLLRTVAFGQQLMQETKLETEPWIKVKEDMWSKIGNMVVDSVESPGPTWVRSAGFEEAWTDVGARSPKQSL